MRKKLNYYYCCCYYYYYNYYYYYYYNYYYYYYYWTFGAPNLKYIAISAYKPYTYIWTSKVQIHKQQICARARAHPPTQPHTHTPTPTPAHTYTHTYTHLDTHGHLRAGGLKRKFSKRERLSRKT